MKANELMIGDWVYDYMLKSYGKIEVLTPFAIQCDIHTDTHHMDFFEPIPLTKEILKANANPHIKYENICGYLSINIRKEGLKDKDAKGHFPIRIVILDGKVIFVHQLQRKNLSTLNVHFFVSGGLYSQIRFAGAEQKIYVKGDMYVEAKSQSTNFFPWPITLPQYTPIEEAPATILAASLSFTRQCKAILCKIAQETEKQKNISPQEIEDLVIKDMKQSKWF